MSKLSNEHSECWLDIIGYASGLSVVRLSAELRVALTRRSFRRSFRQDGDQTKGARERAASLAGTSTHPLKRADTVRSTFLISRGELCICT